MPSNKSLKKSVFDSLSTSFSGLTLIAPREFLVSYKRTFHFLGLHLIASPDCSHLNLIISLCTQEEIRVGRWRCALPLHLPPPHSSSLLSLPLLHAALHPYNNSKTRCGSPSHFPITPAPQRRAPPRCAPQQPGHKSVRGVSLRSCHSPAPEQCGHSGWLAGN